MRNEKLFDLVQELLERMEIAKKEAQDIKMNDGDSMFYFVHCGENEYVNPNFLSFVDQCKIIQLTKFLKEHPEIKDEDLKTMLWMHKMRCGILIDVYNTVENLITEARTHNDEKYISYLYFGLKQNQQKENNTSV